MKRLLLFVFVLPAVLNTNAAAAAAVKQAGTGPVTVDGRRVLVNGEPFFMKGVGYQPVPIGSEVGFPVYDDPKYYAADLQLMRDMGCNTIRTWGGADSTEFLDACWNDGDRPIHVITGPWLEPDLDVSKPAAAEQVMTEWKEFVLKHQDHPAILMWQIGNEHNYWYKHDIKPYLRFINEVGKMVYELEGESWHPFTTAHGGIRNPSAPIGDPVFFTDDENMTYVDVWGANIYSGSSFQDLFDDYSLRSGKPLWISEYGCDALDDRTKQEYQDVHAEFTTGLWKELVDYSDIVSGGTIMAWSDEWWKGGNPQVHDRNGWHSTAQPDNTSNEEWYGIVAVERNTEDPDGPDKRVPRKLYHSLKEEWAKTIEYKNYADRVLRSPATKEARKDLHTASIVPGDPITAGDILKITASSEEDETYPAIHAMDGSEATRWASVHGQDDSWLQIELKEAKKLTGILINWETASAKRYKVRVSVNGKEWKDAAVVTDGEEGEKREIYFDPVTATFVRIQGEERATEWGYSIFELTLNPGAASFK